MNTVLAAAVLSAVLALPASAADLRIEHVTVVSAERSASLADATVIVRDGRIASVSSSDDATRAAATDTRIEGRGLFLAPGLIDTHVHLGEIPGMPEALEAKHPDISKAARAQIPRSFLLHGFTTLIDLVSTPRAMAAWKKQPLVPDTHFCGAAAVMDGYPMNYRPKPMRYMAFPYMLVEPNAEVPAGVDAARQTPSAVVARLKADGALCVKMFFERGFGGVRNLPVPSLAIARETVAAAHAAGLTVLMHANGSEGHAFAVDAGVDVVVHGLWNWGPQAREPVAPSGLPAGVQGILDREIAAQMGWQPTRQVLYGLRDLFSTTFLSDPKLAAVLPASLIAWYRTPEGQWFRTELADDEAELRNPDAVAAEAAMQQSIGPVIDRSRQATAYMVKNGARILFGTDTPSSPSFANPPGLNAALEMQRLVESGESPAQIFKSATLGNARAFKLDRDIGTVEAGKRANLLLLRQDPTTSIDAYADIAQVILGGRVLNPRELRADRSPR